MKPILVESGALYFPDPPWSLGATSYWSITTINRSTGEELSGPVWSFSTLPSSTPIDSALIQPTILAYVGVGLARVICNAGTFSSASNYTCVMRFPLETLPRNSPGSSCC
jgi:hypothetical protein